MTDGTDTLMSPYDVPYSFHTFNVSMFETLIDLNAISNNDGSITLSWGTPFLSVEVCWDIIYTMILPQMLKYHLKSNF